MLCQLLSVIRKGFLSHTNFSRHDDSAFFQVVMSLAWASLVLDVVVWEPLCDPGCGLTCTLNLSASCWGRCLNCLLNILTVFYFSDNYLILCYSSCFCSIGYFRVQYYTFCVLLKPKRISLNWKTSIIRKFSFFFENWNLQNFINVNLGFTFLP